MAFYGRPIEQTYDKPASEIIDEQRFAYPLYVVLLLAPTVHADFAQLQAWAPVFLAVLLAIGVWMWLGVLRWRPPPIVVAALVLFVLSSPQIAQGLRLRQIGLFVAFLLALATWLVTRQRYFMAGILLALCTIKPQLVALCLLWFLLWSVGEWRKRWPLAAGFGVALALLTGVADLLQEIFPHHVAASAHARELAGRGSIGPGCGCPARSGLAESKGYGRFARVYSAAGPVFHRFDSGSAAVDALQPRALVTAGDDVASRLEPATAFGPHSIYCARSMAVDYFARAVTASTVAGVIQSLAPVALGTGASVSLPGGGLDVGSKTTSRIARPRDDGTICDKRWLSWKFSAASI
jgi:hypothetical protein